MKEIKEAKIRRNGIDELSKKFDSPSLVQISFPGIHSSFINGNEVEFIQESEMK